MYFVNCFILPAAVPIIDWPTCQLAFPHSPPPLNRTATRHNLNIILLCVLKHSKIKLKSQLNLLQTEPVLPCSIDCLQCPQPRGFACKKEQVLSYCWLNTARVLAGVVLLSTPAPFSRPPPPTCSGPPGWDLWLWRRRSGQAAVSAALCMAHCKQERKECYNFNRIHFFSTASAITTH